MAFWYCCTSWKRSPLHTSWRCTHTGIRHLVCSPWPSSGCLDSAFLVDGWDSTILVLVPAQPHRLPWAPSHRVCMGIVSCAPVQELGPLLPHCGVVPVVQLTISTGTSTPGRWELSNPQREVWEAQNTCSHPVPRCRNLDPAWSTWSFPNSSIPRVSSEGCRGCGQVPTQKGRTQPLPAPAALKGQVCAGMCTPRCVYP